MTQALDMTDTPKAELPHMLEEHRATVSALQNLIKAASQEKNQFLKQLFIFAG